MIFKTIAPFKDQLKRVHTDGFVVEQSLSTSENAKFTLGALKLEKQGYCQVKNSMQVSWS